MTDKFYYLCELIKQEKLFTKQRVKEIFCSGKVELKNTVKLLTLNSIVEELN